jgi:hypothetical protein
MNFETRNYWDGPYLIIPQNPVRIKVGATYPTLKIFVFQKGDLFGDPLPFSALADFNISFKFYTNKGTLIMEAPATITDIARGLIEYQWSSYDTISAGTFYGEFLFQKSSDNTIQFILPDDGSRIQIIIK